ncbi:exonuclease DPD1, chloroplastic/mitochondrial [Salvia miltiorrhiza]|uniref:exonuclease DPD1, chloroplastic/mitochondrial n=1 Tax=Salvia miltiorrhiza TaxID=226208 RepID=UPI0025AB85CA|nr:exonuclease DPD1, chloroplastic/mitochondrial [Salvia miltiorrhiza]XP_057792159.1 exonuclease DPD1, chloroplastic/mitochondrial [Salvia miltiorrhiza]XP_057792160.1 exonuclease DPD1, chloroplastic/mitochondrial [Salvia miltiorrhiza]XP_057792161.1 exonuclease DPD1, chloroplastic/mitochondrial [Salvia miltiorrhiza]XP_057792162.1 exonuclease DPD1, chloroplastic/mitochondrial [Salvia miltiorrhiza]
MKTIAMCFSLLPFPRCRIHSLANCWWESLSKFRSSSGSSCSYKVLCSNNYELEGGYSRRWTRRTIHSNTGGNKESLTSNKSISRNIIPETSNDSGKLETTKVRRTRKLSIRNNVVSKSSSTEVNTYDERAEVERNQHYADLARLATIICFDIETTGFGKERDRIIEIACQDLRGGENSTLQTLINPERDVPNEQIHGISTNMVNRYDIPRMKDFIPVLLQYVRSRQLPGGVVVLVSHNGTSFDVPFLKREFSRCSYEIPTDWLFLDTLPLARTVMKTKGTKSRVSLQALREHYGIPSVGPAHRALSDVHLLALVLQRLTYDLKLPVSGLIQASFK